MTKSKPSDNLLFAESASSNDVDDPPSAIRSSGYPFESALPHEEFNYLVRSAGRHIDYLERTVGVFPSATSFAAAADPGDYGLLYPIDTYDVSAGRGAEKTNVTSNPGSTNGTISTNGEYVVVSKGTEITVFNEDLSTKVGTHTISGLGTGQSIELAASRGFFFAAWVDADDDVQVYVAEYASPSSGSQTEILSGTYSTIGIGADDEHCYLSTGSDTDVFVVNTVPSTAATISSPSGYRWKPYTDMVASSTYVYLFAEDTGTGDQTIYRANSGLDGTLDGSFAFPVGWDAKGITSNNKWLFVYADDTGTRKLLRYSPGNTDEIYNADTLDGYGFLWSSASNRLSFIGPEFKSLETSTLRERPASSMIGGTGGDSPIRTADGPMYSYVLTDGSATGQDVHAIANATRPVFVKLVDGAGGEWALDGNTVTCIPR